MSSDRWPGRQHMISRDDSDTILMRHMAYLNQLGITADECNIETMSVLPSYTLSYMQGFRCQYTLSWTSYKGWKVYMRHTGCFASITEYENV